MVYSRPCPFGSSPGACCLASSPLEQISILDGNSYDAKCLEAGHEREEDLQSCLLLENNKVGKGGGSDTSERGLDGHLCASQLRQEEELLMLNRGEGERKLYAGWKGVEGNSKKLQAE